MARADRGPFPANMISPKFSFFHDAIVGRSGIEINKICDEG
jgi:hypothetical protein